MTQQPLRLKPKDIKRVREVLLEGQKGKCGLCGLDAVRPSLDHDHDTGYVRSVLCAWCNRIEGVVNHWTSHSYLDRDDFIRRLVIYWAKYGTPQTNMLYPSIKRKRKRRAKNKAKAR